MRPWLLLDVDGPLNPWEARACPDGYSTHAITVAGVGTVDVRLHPDHGSWLLALTDRFDLAWATTWGDHANTYLAQLLGLPHLPVVPLPPHGDDGGRICWKTPAVARWTSGRAFAWLDDDISRRDRNWLDDDSTVGPHLIRNIAPGRGITTNDLDAVTAWADTL